MPDPRDRVRDEIARILRPLAKVREPSRRDSFKQHAKAAFIEAVNELLIRGWSKRGIARHLEIDIHTLTDWLESSTRNPPLWAVRALPLEGRAACFKSLLELADLDDEPPSTRTACGG